MHYKIDDNITIKSEYAAKSTTVPNRIILNVIKSLSGSSMVLDYGCGKLRHTIHLSRYAGTVVAIDSKEQLNLIQTIDGVKTNIVEYASAKLLNVKVIEVGDKQIENYKFDFILCTNVLSAIPSTIEREVVLNNITRLLNNNGKALISIQYRNSYFDQYSENGRSTKFLDGWIIKNKKNHSFYGIITPQNLSELCSRAGLKRLQIYKNNGSVYIMGYKN